MSANGALARGDGWGHALTLALAPTLATTRGESRGMGTVLLAAMVIKLAPRASFASK